MLLAVAMDLFSEPYALDKAKRYEILRTVGRGAFGEVRAREPGRRPRRRCPAGRAYVCILVLLLARLIEFGLSVSVWWERGCMGFSCFVWNELVYFVFRSAQGCVKRVY